MVTKNRWQYIDLASQALVDAMIEDQGIGEEDERVKKASRCWALARLGESPSLIMGDWKHETICFASGYEAALKDMGH